MEELPLCPVIKQQKGLGKALRREGKRLQGLRRTEESGGRFQSGRAVRSSDVGLLGRRWKDIAGRERARRRDGGRRIDL